MSFGETAERLAGVAAGALGWTPGQFWGSTPRELAAALGLAEQLNEAVGRAELEALLSRFPDNREK